MSKNRRDNLESALASCPKDKFRILFDVAPVPMIEGYWQKDFKTIHYNPAAFNLFKANDSAEFINGFSRLLLKIPKKNLLELLSARVKGDVFEGEFFLPTFHGVRVYVLMRLVCIKSTDGGLYHVLLTFQDLSMRRRLEMELRNLAQLDGLTKIFNHKAILRRLEEEFSRAKRYHLDLSCALLDLDSFKDVNDTLGHLSGDKCLKQAAHVLKEGLRKTDIVGRYGGDEFLIIFPETKMERALVPIQRFIDSYALVAEIKNKGKMVKTGFSVGLSGYPLEGVESLKDLIATADQALYTSKQLGEGHISIHPV